VIISSKSSAWLIACDQLEPIQGGLQVMGKKLNPGVDVCDTRCVRTFSRCHGSVTLGLGLHGQALDTSPIFPTHQPP
jgi:hypothetical protein